jgi:hypothetical protein
LIGFIVTVVTVMDAYVVDKVCVPGGGARDGNGCYDTTQSRKGAQLTSHVSTQGHKALVSE